MDILMQQQDAASSGANVAEHFFREDVTLMHKPIYVHKLLTQV